ncbi:hypothetical protein ACRAWD_16600 [Caulobacter segnis]
MDGGQSATSAAFAVGYESISQFSREYRRKFGAPPRNHMIQVARLAKHGSGIDLHHVATAR